MESRGHHASLPHQHWFVAAPGQHLDTFADALDAWRADEDHLQRLAAKRACRFYNRGIDLPAISVAADGHVDGIQSRLMRILHLPRQQDGAGAGAEGWLNVHEIIQLPESFLFQQLQKCARFPTRNHESIDGVELFRLAHQYDLRPKLFQAAAMRIEIAL